MPGQFTRSSSLIDTGEALVAHENVTRSFFSALLMSFVCVCATFSSAAYAQSQNDSESTSQSTHQNISFDTLQYSQTNSSDESSNPIINQRSISSRVLGGAVSEPGEWPSVVALVRTGLFPLENRLFCGGTIVADRWIMTAAHCLFDAFGNQVRPSSIRVVAGITDLRNDIPDEESIVTNIVVHPRYEHDTERVISFDIALLELGASLDQPAVTLFAEESENFVGTLGFIAGWGAIQYIDENNALFPTKLQDAMVPLVSNAVCNAPESYNGAIVDNQLCAGYVDGGIDTCSGDSGGPLFIVRNGQRIQVGITGFGNGCALPLFYGIYTDVSHFIPWLSSYIQVPPQSQNLIDARQAADLAQMNMGSESDGGLFGGTSHPIVILLMGLMSLGRKWAQSGISILLQQVRRSQLPSMCGIVLVFLASSCSIAGNPKAMQLPLASDDGRAGLSTHRLGDDYSRVREQLRADNPDMSVCKSDLATVRGTGRLSLRVLCSVTPDSIQHVAGSNVQAVDYLFLDDQLVRISVKVEAESLDDLTSMLDTRYKQLTSSPSLIEWRSELFAEDHVRLLIPVRNKDDQPRQLKLQFIDGRLKDRVPSLFAIN